MGKLEFSEDDIQKTQRGLDASGVKLPNFSEMGAHFGEPQVPQLTEEEIIFQALTECEYDIVQLQAIIRGYLLRQMLYNDRYILKSLLGPIIALQSIIRAKNSRKVYASYVDDISTAIPIISRLQAISRAKIGRKQLHKFKSQIERQEPAIIKLQSIIRATATRLRLIVCRFPNSKLSSVVTSLVKINTTSRRTYNLVTPLLWIYKPYIAVKASDMVFHCWNLNSVIISLISSFCNPT